MPKPVASVGEGDGGSSKLGIYNFIRDLINEGKHAKFVNSEGRFAVNWPRALECYEEYKSSKNPTKTKSRNIDKRKASNGLRAALLNFYKKEGAKEFKECKKVNEKDEVIERQFQMPPRVFKTLFEDSHFTEDSEQDSSSLMSGDEDETTDQQIIFAHGSPQSSDTGFDEAMDVLDGSPNAFSDQPFSFSQTLSDSQPGEINPENVLWNDITTPSQMFQLSEEEFDTAFKEILSDGISESDIDLTGVVQDISPSSGSVKGGQCFHILLSEPLADEVFSGEASFEGCGTVFLEKLNCSTFKGILPAAQQPGPVPVTVQTLTGQYLGKTWFFYVDEVQEVLRQLVKDAAMQSLFFNLWAQEHGSLGNDSDISQSFYPLIVQNQGSSNQTKSVQSLDVLQLLIYTAAQTNAQQFIKMIFSTSAGKTVFNAYKNRSPLPEDVAMANGHHELAVYLQDITGRYSEQNSSCGVQSGAIDWLELAQAVQDTNKLTPGTVVLPCSQETNDNLSDYFADVETSSCGSFDFEWCDSEEKGFSINDKHSQSGVPCERLNYNVATPRTSQNWESDGVSGNNSLQTEAVNELNLPLDIRSHEEQDMEEPTGLQGASDKESSDQWKELDTEATNRKEDVLKNVKPSTEGTSSSSFGKKITHWLFKGSEKRNSGTPDGTSVKRIAGRTTTPGGGSSEPRVWATSSGASKIHCSLRNQKHGVLYATVTLLLLLSGFKLHEDELLRWAVENGQMQIANILVRFGGDINAQDAHMRTPLHLAAKQGHREITRFLLQHGSNIDVKDCLRQTPLHLAVQNGHLEVAKLLLQRGVDSCIQDFRRQIPLHLAVQNGHMQIAEVLPLHSINSSTQDFRGQSPVHLASQVGHKGLVDLLLQHGAKAFVQHLNGQTSLHLASKYGHTQIVELLLEQVVRADTVDFSNRNPRQLPSQKRLKEAIYSIDAHTEDFNGQTPLHLAARYGHKDITQILLQHGFDAFARDLKGHTPLHLAAQNKHQQIAFVLLLQQCKKTRAQNKSHQADCTLHQYVACSGDAERQNPRSFAEDFKGQNLYRLTVRNGHNQTAVTLHSGRAGVYFHSHSDRFDLVAKDQLMKKAESPVVNALAACSENLICRTPHKEITDPLYNDFTQDVMCRASHKEISGHLYNNSIAEGLTCRTSAREITGRLYNDSIAQDFRRQGPLQVAAQLTRKGMLLALFCSLSYFYVVTVVWFVFIRTRCRTQEKASSCSCPGKEQVPLEEVKRLKNDGKQRRTGRYEVHLECNGSADKIAIGDEVKLTEIQKTVGVVTSNASPCIITPICVKHRFHRTDVSQVLLNADEMRLEYGQYESQLKCAVTLIKRPAEDESCLPCNRWSHGCY